MAFELIRIFPIGNLIEKQTAAGLSLQELRSEFLEQMALANTWMHMFLRIKQVQKSVMNDVSIMAFIRMVD